MRLINAIPSTDPREFMLANMCSPVVHAAGRAGGGVLFTLANMRRFELSAVEVNAMGMPIWGEAE
ncbi:hypothetical protein [Novosphingobium humi]|uniref:hypothetical protein n=1 Tax=Novosphingobium humi TaxID=2282397 RepID=UPI0025AF7F22|nr:hypothetical protein [Novosphingobium humi]WJS97819.1 hypothetical protein NYQ05_11815 [Novosphingobium humi]